MFISVKVGADSHGRRKKSDGEGLINATAGKERGQEKKRDMLALACACTNNAGDMFDRMTTVVAHQPLA